MTIIHRKKTQKDQKANLKKKNNGKKPEQEKTKLSRGSRIRIRAGIFSGGTKTLQKPWSVTKLSSLGGESRRVARFPEKNSPAAKVFGHESVHRFFLTES